MLSESSMDKISHIINNNRQPKKRISKACIKCKNSKNKCINIEKGVCERCIELNEICIYDYSHNNMDDDSKVLISKEYLTLLQNKSMLTELILKTLFNDFDKLINNGIFNIDTKKDIDSSLSKQRDLWNLLINENHQFCNPNEVHTNFNHMTSKYKSNLEINPLIQLVLPHEISSAVNAINHVGNNDIKNIFAPSIEGQVDTKATVVSNEHICKKRRRTIDKPLMKPLLPSLNSDNKLPRLFNKSRLMNDLLYNQREYMDPKNPYERSKSNESNEENKKNCRVKIDLKMILND
ncbi:uncharacterized protein HGUI_00129 [Hanseniaspora guilliermondii]|uniref:Zn(2)-C6 fungal-type domain-containing protein n=1 Tax=Hanseniaspora guilliermondii TaxID=56406 RepID=A0A1L0CI06_9ASCO|nr:uncharacterized protein HGUI_00129 [Hanseniaspora guilliermondii]